MEDAIPQGVPGGLQAGHEGTTIQIRGVLIGTIGLVVIIAVCQVLLGLWMARFNRDEERVNALYPNRHDIEIEQFPQPRLQESPPVDLVSMLREERARTSSYGWVNKEAGIARIPVDRALEILAAKGLPKVAAPPPQAGAPRDTTIPPARKREEAGPEEDHPAGKKTEQPAPARTEDRPRPETKQGGKP